MARKFRNKPAAAAAVQFTGVSEVDLEASAHEIHHLANALNIEFAGTFQQKRDHLDVTAFPGIGRIAVKSNLASFKVIIKWE